MLLANIHDLFEIENFIGQNKNSFYENIKLFAQKGNRSKKVGFFGQPDQRTINIFKKAGYQFLDLDINFHSPKQDVVPDVYCHIIRDIVNNLFYFKNELEYVICTTGRDKCDQGRNVRDLFSQKGFKVIDASNINSVPLRKPIISQACGNLKQRIIRIMELIYKPLSASEEEYYLNNQCESRFNFHGVPPQDIELLTIFPDDTHIYGWTRLVEMGIPSRVDLEWDIDDISPTVYFSQSFCNKQMMAEHLAQKNHGLYIDEHGRMTDSIRAKLEAFVSLKGRKAVFSKNQPVEHLLSGAKL